MSRNLTAEVIAELTAATCRPLFLFQGDFSSGNTIRLCDGVTNFVWGGDTYLGNGWFKGMSPVRDDNDIRANGVDILLSGVPSSLVSLILSNSNHSCEGWLWLAMLDSSDAIIDDPYLLFYGKLSAPRIDDSSDIAEIMLTYEDALIVLQRSSELRYNHETQIDLFPGDRGLEYVAGLENWSGFWGTKVKKKRKEDSKSKRKKTGKEGRR